MAAYSAGQNDGAASLARERRAAQYAKVAGKESGLVYGEFVRQAVESGRTAEDGELLDEFIQKNRDNRTLLEKMRDAIRRLIRKLRGSRYQAMTAGERRVAIDAEKKLTAALDAAARQVKSLQSKSGDGTMSQTKYSVKYWRPDLNAAEWKLLNRRMQREIGDPAHSLDEATQWAYAEEKEVRVFAIYGVGDGTEATPLLAVGGENAHVAYELLMSKMEDIENGINGNGADISQWINIIRSNQKHGRRNSDASGRAGTASKEIDKLHGGASGSNAEGIAGTGDQNEKVKPRLSLKTPVEESRKTRYSIKRTKNMTLAQQLKMFYDGKMASSDAFYFGETPDMLNAAGLDTLPLAFTIADFKKSTQKKHNVPRRVLKNLRQDLEMALFAFGDGDRIGILTADIDGDGKPLLVAIQKNVQMDVDKVNVIRSVYGLDNPGRGCKIKSRAGKSLSSWIKKKRMLFSRPTAHIRPRWEMAFALWTVVYHKLNRKARRNSPSRPRTARVEADEGAARVLQRQQGARGQIWRLQI